MIKVFIVSGDNQFQWTGDYIASNKAITKALTDISLEHHNKVLAAVEVTEPSVIPERRLKVIAFATNGVLEI